MEWQKGSHTGVRFKLHKTRKHRGRYDRMYSIRYKSKEETCGWASEGMNAQKAYAIRSELTENIRLGKRPQSLKEKRELEKERVEAKTLLKQLEQKENITFHKIATEYLNWLKNNSKRPDAELGRYNNHIKAVLGDIPAKNITPLTLERFKRDLEKKGLAPKTIHHCLCLITTIYRKATKWGKYSSSIPTAKVDFPKINNSRVRYLTHQEAEALFTKLKAKSINAWAECMLGVFCGLRSGEIRNMRWGNINLKESIIHLPETKSGESQSVFAPKQIKAMLLNLLPESPMPNNYVITGRNGGQSSGDKSTFKKVVNELGFNAGIDPRDRRNRVVFHSLRHTFCSWLAIDGTPLYTIQKLARHKNITQTERYAHLCPDHKRSAINKLADNFDLKTGTQSSKKIYSISQ